MRFIATFLILANYAVAEPSPTLTSKDVLRHVAPDGSGIPLLAKTVGELEKQSKAVKLTAKAINIYEFGSDVIESINFDEFFKSNVTTKRDHNWRGITLVGTKNTKGDAFIIDAIPGPSSKQVLKQFPDFASDLDMRIEDQPTKDEKRGFAMQVAAFSHTGGMNHRNVQEGGSYALKFLSPDNMKTLPPEKDQAVLADLKTTLPQTMKIANTYLKLQPGITTSGDSTIVKTKIDLQFEALEEDFPDLGEYFINLFDSFDFDAHLVYEDAKGNTLWKTHISSGKRRIELSFLAKDGKLIPTNKKGEPEFAHALDLSGLKNHKGKAIASIFGDVLGIKFAAKDVTLSQAYQDGDIANFSAKLVSLPPPEVTGRALGIIPPWLIDAMIPGSIDEYARKFSEGLMHGSEGSGTYLTGTFDTRSPENNRLAIKGQSLLIDNFFVNFGMRVVQSYIWPNPDVIADAHMLANKILTAFANDLNQLAAAEAQMVH